MATAASSRKCHPADIRGRRRRRARARGSQQSCIQPCSSHSRMAPASFSTEIAQPWSVRIVGRRSMVLSIEFSHRMNPCTRPFFPCDLTGQGFDCQASLGTADDGRCKSPTVCQRPCAHIRYAPCQDRSSACCRFRPPALSTLSERRVERAPSLLTLLSWRRREDRSEAAACSSRATSRRRLSGRRASMAATLNAPAGLRSSPMMATPTPQEPDTMSPLLTAKPAVRVSATNCRSLSAE
jgi:hypothetical protein